MWAQKAMPVAVFDNIREVVPLNNCPRNQMPMYMTAGIGRNSGMMKMGINDIIVLFGNIIMYAAIMAEIAPDAPMAGTVEFRYSTKWVRLAINPHSR